MQLCSIGGNGDSNATPTWSRPLTCRRAAWREAVFVDCPHSNWSQPHCGMNTTATTEIRMGSAARGIFHGIVTHSQEVASSKVGSFVSSSPQSLEVIAVISPHGYNYFWVRMAGRPVACWSATPLLVCASYAQTHAPCSSPGTLQRSITSQTQGQASGAPTTPAACTY